ncbi:MAG: site-specific integrase, partial [Nitrospinota bacterium]|nr:site-specific integrase [Nitrospinota bacterium]
MATFRKRNNKWHVQIRRKHHPSMTKTFLSKKVAQKWIRGTESKIDQGCLIQSNAHSSITLKQLILRYMVEVLVKKKSCCNEMIIL